MVTVRPLSDERFGPRRFRPNHLASASVCRIAIYPRLLAVQEIGEDVTVVNVRSGRHDRVNDTLAAIGADVRLHAKIPLVALPGRMHLRIALAALVLGR